MFLLHLYKTLVSKTGAITQNRVLLLHLSGMQCTSTSKQIFVTHLHKTSLKSPKIKCQKIAFYLKMSKYVIFKICFLSKYLFLHYSARFFEYFWLF